MSWSYWAFSPLYMFPLPLNTVAEFTCWSPSTCMHSCSIACLLSRPEEGVTCYIIGFFLIYNKGQGNLIYMYLLFGVHWSPSTCMHSCSIACLLSRPEEGVTCYIIGFFLIYNKGQGNLIYMYLLFGVHRPYFTSQVELSYLLLDLTASLMSWWNFWIGCHPSSAACFFSCLFFSWMKYHVFF